MQEKRSFRSILPYRFMCSSFTQLANDIAIKQLEGVLVLGSDSV
jgi:hypothetical protein